MFGTFWSVWCKMAIQSRHVNPMMMPCPYPSSSRLLKAFFKSKKIFIMEKCLISEDF